MKKAAILISVLVFTIQLFSQAPTWKTLPNSPSTNWRQDDLFFVNENTGWVSGDEVNTFKTTNAGLTWQFDNFGSYVNRIRFINDTIGYAVGKRVYKYTREPIGIQPISSEIPQQFVLHQNYPNPFNPVTKIKFEVPAGGIRHGVFLRIYDALGREIETLVNEQLHPGVYEVGWDASNYPSGIYFYKLISKEFSESKKIVLIK